MAFALNIWNRRVCRRKLLVMTRAILRMLPLLGFGVPAAFGCSMQSMELRQVSPDLIVVVTHRGKPIAGITVQVVPENSVEPAFTRDTDEHGTVLIEGLIVGRYHLTASREGFDAGKEWIEVVATPDAKTKKRFEFQWADWSYQTRSAAGTLTGLVAGETGHPLMDIVHPKETVFPGVDIALKGCTVWRRVSDGLRQHWGIPDRRCGGRHLHTDHCWRNERHIRNRWHHEAGYRRHARSESQEIAAATAERHRLRQHGIYAARGVIPISSPQPAAPSHSSPPGAATRSLLRQSPAQARSAACLTWCRRKPSRGPGRRG